MENEATCPQCNATDNKPYTTENGTAMRACFRCLIQWRDGTRPAPHPSGDLVDAARDFAMHQPWIENQHVPHAGDQVAAFTESHLTPLRDERDGLKKLLSDALVVIERPAASTYSKADYDDLCTVRNRIGKALGDAGRGEDV